MLKALTQRWLPKTAAPAHPLHAGLRAGDAAAIEEALCELLPAVRRWIYRRLGPDAALDDVAQEALTEIARALPSFAGESHLTTYAYRICARVISRHQRRFRARLDAPSSAPEALDPQSPEPESRAQRDRAPSAARGAGLFAAPARAPARGVHPVRARRREPGEAAELLGVSPNAVRSRLMHARRELDRRLHGSAVLSQLRSGR